MAANIDSNLANWSTTAASNQPDTTDSNDIVSDLRQIQVVVRKYLATKGSDIASGATVDLSTATGNYVHVTGITTVTALGTVAAGLRYLLVFDGALTFTHNATSLILPGGANITTAAGDRCEVISLGSGNWRCLWFQPAAGTPLVTVPVANGGTGSTSASAARTALGLAIGTDVQAYDADLAAIAGLTSAANKIPMFSGSGTATVIDFKDEDNMVSDSATAVPSQQSVKAYVTSQLVQIASTAETQAGTSTTKAVSPGGLLGALGMSNHYKHGDTTTVCATSGTTAIAHGLGATPRLIQIRLKCKTADNGYAIGDEIVVSLRDNGGYGSTVSLDATNITVHWASLMWTSVTKGGGAGALLTATSWYFIVDAWA